MQPDPRPAVPLSRPRHGRFIGGVCAALADVRGLRVGWIRAAFVATLLFAGIGGVVYLACWLILPPEGDPDAAKRSSRVALLAQVSAACAGLLTLAAVATVATVFGFGWIALAAGGAILLVVLVAWPRVAAGWALLPIAALAVPSIAVAGEGWRLAPSTRDVRVAPQTLAGRPVFRAGLGTMFVDLRHTAFPASGTIHLRVEAGVRRTIVALPNDRCVHVDLTYHVDPTLVQLASLVTGQVSFRGIVVFGSLYFLRSGEVGLRASVGSGPLLKIDFSSQGGGLYVRDYPDSVDPEVQPDWPGYPVEVESSPPDTSRVSRREAAREMRAWRARRQIEIASQRQIDALMPGPCGPVEPTGSGG